MKADEKGRKKNYRFVPFLPGAEKKMQKKSQKIKKTKKHYYGFFSSHKRLEKADKERK